MKRLSLLIVFFVLTVMQAHAVQPNEMLADPTLEGRARNISSGLRCLVCQNESIDESNADLARDLRLLVRERLTQGDSDEQVKEFLVARYGDYVLLKPPFNAQTVILWTLPFFIVIMGLIIIIRRKPPQTPAAEQCLTAEEKEKLRNLSRLDDAV